MKVTFVGNELFASRIFYWKTTNPINIVEKLETVAVSVSSEQTLHGYRDTAVKRPDGEETQDSKNGKLAGSQ